MKVEYVRVSAAGLMGLLGTRGHWPVGEAARTLSQQPIGFYMRVICWPDRTACTEADEGTLNVGHFDLRFETR